MNNGLYVYGESKPRKRYFVADERIDGDGDRFCKSFFTKEEAIAEAESEWERLTERERRDRRIIVGYIDKNDVLDNALGERSIVGDIDPDDWDAAEDETWYSNFSLYEIVHEHYGR